MAHAHESDDLPDEFNGTDRKREERDLVYVASIAAPMTSINTFGEDRYMDGASDRRSLATDGRKWERGVPLTRGNSELKQRCNNSEMIALFLM